jgi:GNAT superfamily N-acetyltransferase
MLLRGLDRDMGKAELLVAVQPAPPHIVGVLSYRRLVHALASLRLRVVRTERRRGIGGALLSAALDEARRIGARTVFAKVDPAADGDGAPFLGRHGFAHTLRLTTVEGDIDDLLRATTDARERLRARGRIPAEARIVLLPDAPVEQVARLYAEHIAHNPELAARLAVRSPRDAGLAVSPVAMVGDEVAGFVLWAMHGTVGHVHARVVSPAYRGLWPNTVLMADALERGASLGGVRVRFEVPGENLDTLKLARRLRADTVSTTDLFRLDLEAKPEARS